MISYKGYSKSEVLAALWNASHVQGMGVFQSVAGHDYMTAEEADKIIHDRLESMGEQGLYFDYLEGRVLKVDLRGNSEEFDERLFDRDCGHGAAYNAISQIVKGVEKITDEIAEEVRIKGTAMGIAHALQKLGTNMEEALKQNPDKKNVENVLDQTQEKLRNLLRDIFKAQNEGMYAWACDEVKLIKEKSESADPKKGERFLSTDDYLNACYDAALEAFGIICSQNHSGMSINIVKSILNAMIIGNPLSPIEDTEDQWNLVDEDHDGDKKKTYQCKRMHSLFKDVSPDGSVTYSDVNRVSMKDINTDTNWHNGLCTRLINEMFPITMPYSGGKTYTVYAQEFLTDEKNGDYDTLGFLYVVDSDGNRTEINRFFKDITGGYQEITEDEYHDRILMHEVRVLTKQNKEKNRDNCTNN